MNKRIIQIRYHSVYLFFYCCLLDFNLRHHQRKCLCGENFLRIKKSMEVSFNMVRIIEEK